MSAEQAQSVIDILSQTAETVLEINTSLMYLIDTEVVIAGLVAGIAMIYFLFHGKWR